MVFTDNNIKDKFEKIIAKIPPFLQRSPAKKVSARIKAILEKENRIEVTEKDLVDAFFVETPFGFHGPLKTDMQTLGIDYTKYGHAP